MQIKYTLNKAALEINHEIQRVQKAKAVETGHTMKRKKSVTRTKLPLLAI